MTLLQAIEKSCSEKPVRFIPGGSSNRVLHSPRGLKCGTATCKAPKVGAANIAGKSAPLNIDAACWIRLLLNISRSSQQTFRSRAKLPSPSPAPPGPPICRVRALLRCRGQLELGPQPRERRLRAKASWLSCAGCEMTMVRRFSFSLDLYPCFCGSFFVSVRQQRAGLRTDC